MRRIVPVFVALVLASGSSALAQVGPMLLRPAEASRIVVVAQTAPITIRPTAGFEPLRIAQAGSALGLLSYEGEWCLVEFKDPQLGRRVGYIQTRALEQDDPKPRPASPSVAKSVPAIVNPPTVVSRPAPVSRPQPASSPTYSAAAPAAVALPSSELQTANESDRLAHCATLTGAAYYTCMHPGEAPSTPLIAMGDQPKGMSTKKKVIIGSIVGAAIAGAVIWCIKSDDCPGGGGGSGSSGGGSNLSGSSQGIFPLSPELLLFGGRDHRVFLGCLNCSEYDSGSVFNKFGDHGSPYATDSIFNRYGDYGSPYSDSSACSRYASDPPIVVDRQGNAYGRLTVNRFAYQISNPSIVAWLNGVCQH